MAETVLIHHSGMPADPPVVNGITFVQNPDDPALWIGEASIQDAQILCHPGSPFQTDADLPPVEVAINPQPSAPVAPEVPVLDPFYGSPAGALVAAAREDAVASLQPVASPIVEILAPDPDPDVPTSGPGITEPVVPDNVVPANPVASAQVEVGLDPVVLNGLREEQADLQAKQARTPEDEARLQAISDELAFAGFAQ